MASPINHLPFQDPLPFPAVVDARAGGSFDFDVVPAKAILHSAIPEPQQDNCWSVVPAGTAAGAKVESYLGPLLVAQRGTPVTMNWTNRTAATGAPQPAPPIRVVRPVYMMDPGRWAAPKGLAMHLHGGRVLAQSDGWPLAENPPGGTQRCDYPNDQPANLIWYHDHAMDWTARIVHAGIAGGYVLRDAFDDELMTQIPAANEIPLVLQDRQLWDPDQGKLTSIMRYEINADPTSAGGLTRPAIDIDGSPIQANVLPEFFGEFNLVNGRLWPRHDLPARDLYRLRLLNGCNARTYALKLMAQVGGVWRFVDHLMTVIGTDGGLMGAAIPLAPKEALVIAPGERRDVMLDLRGLAVDVVDGIAQLFIVNVAAVPYSSNAASVPSTTNGLLLGLTPDSILRGAARLADAPFHAQIQGFPQIMRFDVDMNAPVQPRPAFLSVKLPVAMVQARAANPDFHYRSASGWRPYPGVNFGPNRVFLIDNAMANMPMHGQNIGMMYLRECERLPSTADADLILRWDADTAAAAVNPRKARAVPVEVGYGFDRRMKDPMNMPDMMNDTFERPLRLGAPTPGTYERWYFVNLYPNAGPLLPNPVPQPPLDMHPVHIHLISCYLARRWAIAADGRQVGTIGNPGLYAKLALRDTVRVNGSEIVELIVYFPDGYQQSSQPFPSPFSRYPFHCHILEHEEMGMMRHFDYG